jgi:sigma-B regulation protein RsbU (phosphoserine phosphatase)
MTPSTAPSLPLASILLPVLIVLLVALAAYAAVVTRRHLIQDREHEQQLTRLGELSARLGQTHLDPEELAEVAYEEAARFLETDFFQFGIFEGHSYRTLIWIRDYERQDNQVFDLRQESEGIVGWIRDTGQPLLVRDFVAERESLPARPGYDSADPPRSAAFVPLAIEGQVLGVLGIQSRRPKAFGPRDLRLMQLLAAALTIRLAVATLHAEVRYRTLHIALLREISRQVTALKPIRELLSGIVNVTAEALDGYTVRLYEQSAGRLLLRASSTQGEGNDAPELPLPEWLSKSRARCLDASWPEGIDTGTPPGASGHLIIPLRAEDYFLGTLDLQHLAGDPIPLEHAELAETIGAQLALAILEARNFAQQQEEAWVTTVLLEVARHAAQTGDADVALEAVLRLATLLAGVSWAIVLLPDPDGRLRVGPAAGLPRQFKSEHEELRVSPAEVGAAMPTLESETPYPTVLPDHLAEHLESKDAIALALSDGEHLLGVLLLQGQELTGRRPALLAGIAHQISLRLENARLIETVALQRSFEREMSMARGIQESFLPKEPPAADGWEVGITWRLAREVGGDFYDFIPLEPGPDGPRWGVAIADVAGKGVPAALFMALSRTLLRSVAISRLDPGLTLTRLNDLIINDTQADMFVSVFYAVWEPATGKLTYANGGHNPPMVFQPGSPCTFLDEHQIVLGIEAGVDYQTHSMTLGLGSLLVLSTDGVTEAPDAHGELFGAQRLEALILGSGDWDASALAGRIAARVSDFNAEPDLRDDLTAVVIRRLP